MSPVAVINLHSNQLPGNPVTDSEAQDNYYCAIHFMY